MNAHRTFWAWAGLMTAVVTGGCGPGGTFAARQLVEPDTGLGRAALSALGGPTAGGKVDARRRVEADDGTVLDVWIIQGRDASGLVVRPAPRKKTVVLLHPMLMSKAWWLPLGRRLAADGYDVVLPDLRAHGRSGGQYVTWGALEKTDIRSILDAVITEDMLSRDVYVVGASLGGCVAIQYAAVDPRCKGVLALAPPTGVEGVARRMSPFSSQSQLDDTLIRAETMASFDRDQASAVKAAEKLKCPLILVHGLFDMVVPVRHSEKIYAAATGPKQFIKLALAGHTTVQVGRGAWIAERIAELGKMASAPPAQAKPSSPD